MDSPSSQPEIKPVVLKEEGKPAGGLLGGLLSKLGLGAGSAAGAGAGGLGAGGLGSGAGLGAGLAGGLLATKAGLVGLILVGSTLAGGIGLIGYKAFGPGAADRSDAKFSSLFEARPASAPQAEGEAGAQASKDGHSTSLDYLAKANVDKSQADGDKAKADADAAADAAAPKVDASAQAPVGTAQNLGAALAAKANPSLKTDKKFGALSKMGSGGGGGSSGASAGAGAAPSVSAGGLLASAKMGSSQGMSAGRAASVGARKGMRAARSGAAGKRAFGQMSGLQKTLASGGSARPTYDGGDARLGALGGDSPIGAGGAGIGAGKAGSSPSASPTANPDDRFPSPPKPQAKNVTPWQGLINQAMMLIAAAAVLLMLASKLAFTAKAKAGTPAALASGAELAIARVLAGIAGLIGLFVIALGAQIGGGEYGQKLQGGMLSLAGGFILATSATCVFATQFFGNHLMLMQLCGGLGLAAAMGTYLMPPKSYPPSEFPDGQPPDRSLFKFGYRVPPSEEALKDYFT